MAVVNLEDFFEKSKDGRLENRLPSPEVSKLPLIEITNIKPSEIGDAQKAKRTEAAADLDASINSASEPDHESDPKPVAAARETER